MFEKARVSSTTTQIPVKQIVMPSSAQMFRDVDLAWVQEIKAGIIATMSTDLDPFIVCVQDCVSTLTYDNNRKNDYKYVCLGHTHLFCAVQEVVKHFFESGIDEEREKAKKWEFVEVKIYAGLDDEQTRTLGAAHNAVQHNTKVVNTRDLLKSLRREGEQCGVLQVLRTGEKTSQNKDVQELKKQCFAKAYIFDPHQIQRALAVHWTLVTILPDITFDLVLQVIALVEQGKIEETPVPPEKKKASLKNKKKLSRKP